MEVFGKELKIFKKVLDIPWIVLYIVRVINNNSILFKGVKVMCRFIKADSIISRLVVLAIVVLSLISCGSECNSISNNLGKMQDIKDPVEVTLGYNLFPVPSYYSTITIRIGGKVLDTISLSDYSKTYSISLGTIIISEFYYTRNTCLNVCYDTLVVGSDTTHWIRVPFQSEKLD